MSSKTAGRAILLATALAWLFAVAAPAAAECNDRWQTANKLTEKANALQKRSEYAQASAAFETAALAWQRAAGDCTRVQADTAKHNAQVCAENARLMICLKNYDAAQVIANHALALAGQGKWKQAEETYDEAQRAWLLVAQGCDKANAQRAKRNAQEAAKNAAIASDNYLAQKRRGD